MVLQSGLKSPSSCFFHRFRHVKTSTGLRITPKSLSLVGTVPTDLPAKEFLKKLNPVPSYGPKRDGASHRDSRRSSRFPPNFTKTTMARSTVKISAQFKEGGEPPHNYPGFGPKISKFGRELEAWERSKVAKKVRETIFFIVVDT